MTVIQQLSGDSMKIILFFPLLLLLCSASADQTETTVQQSCPQDIHAVLRELAASLAVQNERISVLQKENQDYEAKLKSLESQMTETEKLKQQLQARQVAFSASLMSAESQTIGPFDSHTVLIYNHVFTNIGNAYSPHTGIFAAPVRGAYHFDFHIAGPGDDSHGLCAVLVRNGLHVVTAWDQKQSVFGSASNGVTLILESGDQVFMRLWSNYKIYDDKHHYSTFSGHMLFAM